jgi:hypothetical protein
VKKEALVITDNFTDFFFYFSKPRGRKGLLGADERYMTFGLEK